MSSVDPGLSIDARRHFLYALRRVLRPIIRLLIRAGVRYDEFVDVARGAYVESAIRDGVDTAFHPTREEIALITGIPRQRVDHYIDNEDALPTADSAPTLRIPEILHKWYTDPQYAGPYGIPLELEFDAISGPDFQSLVAQVDRKENAGWVLNELLRAGSVAYTGENRLRAITRQFIKPEAFSCHRIEIFGATLARLARTLEHNFNVADAENKRLERSVFADGGLPEQLFPSFQTYARQRAEQFLCDLDDWLARCVDADPNPSGSRVEAGVNVFLYVEPPSDSKSLSALVQPRRIAASDSDLSPNA